MALGKAFIEVHADTKPFARELGRELGRILRVVEQTPARRIGEAFGEKISDGIGDGVRRNRDRIGKSLGDALGSAASVGGAGSRLAQGIIDSIDDGLSGLPAEIKVALGAALAAVSPFIGAAISGAVSGGLALAFAGVGVLFASQFQIVQDQWDKFFRVARADFLQLGSVFVLPVVAAIALIEDRFGGISQQLGVAFQIASQYILPITDALLGFVEFLLPGLVDAIGNLGPVVREMQQGFRTLGLAIGTALSIITDTPYAARGLRDLLFLISILVVEVALFIRGLTELYGILTDIAMLFADPKTRILTAGIDAANESADNATDEFIKFGDAQYFALAATDAQTKAIQEQQRAADAVSQAIRNYADSVTAAWNADINFEQSLDDMTETLRKHRGALNLNSQAGRDNQQAILTAATALRQQRDDQIALTGDVVTANREFATNRKRLEDAAVAAGISRARYRELTDTLLNLPPPVDVGISQAAVDRAGRALGIFRALAGVLTNAIFGGAIIASGGRLPAYANGGVVSTPTVGLIGEAGPEAVVPLNNPARAAQVMSQAGLADMMGPQVNVYIGNQQIDAYIDRRVDSKMAATSRGLAYGTRSV